MVPSAPEAHQVSPFLWAMGWQGSPLYAHHHVALPYKLMRVNRSLPGRKNTTMAAETSAETGDLRVERERALFTGKKGREALL